MTLYQGPQKLLKVLSRRRTWSSDQPPANIPEQQCITDLLTDAY